MCAVVEKDRKLPLLGRWDEGESELRKAMEFARGSVVVRQQSGDVLRELGRRCEAIDFYKKALEVQPSFELQEKLDAILSGKHMSASSSAADDHNREQSDSQNINGKIVRLDKVVASLASIPDRVESLEITVNALYPQIDRLNVYLNDYPTIPSFLMREKIYVARSQVYGNLGDSGKFFWCEEIKGYHFTCDDDVAYPPDYIETLIGKIEEYQRKAVVGVHGAIFRQPFDYYQKARNVFNYLHEVKEDTFVQQLGTGVMAYHTSTIEVLRNEFEHINMADIWFGLLAQKYKIPIIVIKHQKGWLKQNEIDMKKTIYEISAPETKNYTLSTRTIQDYVIKQALPWRINYLRNKPILVMSLTTFNNKRYLQEFIYSWEKTKSHKYHWVLIIADNGSTDGTIEYLFSIKPFWQFTLIQKQGLSDAELTNTIFDECKNTEFDYGFYADNDVLFLKPGWDELYINAIEKSGYVHLCHRNNEYLRKLVNGEKLSGSVLNQKEQIDTSGYCSTIMDASQYMGITKLFTFNRQTIERVGYADANKLPDGKQWQVDISKRYSRVGFNDGNKYWDAKDSNEYLQIQGIVDDGHKLIGEYEKVAASLLAKSKIIEDEQRIYVDKPTELNLIQQKDYDINQYFDNIYLINLDSQVHRWHQASEWAKKCGINLTRFLGVDGNAPEPRKEWEDYTRQGLVKLPGDIRPIETTEEFYFNYQYDVARVVYIEQKSGKKGIPTPEAWGYLLSVIHVLEDAITKGYQRILVLDDDIVPHKLIKSLFAQGMREAPEDWKIILLGAFQDLWDGYITPYSECLYQSNGTNEGSFAMALDCSVFVPLLHYAKKFDLTFDLGALHRVQRKHKDKCFIFTNPLMIADSETRNRKPSVTQNANRKDITLDRVDEYLHLAKLNSEQKLWPKALTFYEQALSLVPRADAYLGMAKVLMELGKWEEAITTYRQVITLVLSGEEKPNCLSDTLSDLEIYKQVVFELQHIAKLHPESDVNWQLMGDVLQTLERWDEAKSAYQRAIKLNPESAWNHFHLSRILCKLEPEYQSSDVVLVLIPAYNAEFTIYDSIHSVLNQTHKLVEIVAIDDCSRDKTFEILKKEEEKHINIRVFKTPKNMGTYNAVNYGLHFAQQSNFGFFTIHGADDLMFPEKIKLQLEKLKAEDGLACRAGYARVDYHTKAQIKSSRVGHSTVIYSKRAFHDLGYYDHTRFGGDTEYLERFISYYGNEKIVDVKKILTIAYFANTNLTANNPDDSQRRIAYVKQFEQKHINMKILNDFYVENPIENQINTSFNQTNKQGFFRKSFNMVVAGVASLLERKDALKDTVESILPQVDKLIVYQNGYKEKFDFLNHRKIEIFSSLDTNIDMGDAGKFYRVDHYQNCYYFSIDDDLIYSSDYISVMIDALKKYENRIIVTCHGRIFKPNPKSYYKDNLSVYRCLDDVASEDFIHFGGTGVMAFHTGTVKINFGYFKAPNMADIWLGLYARENNIPIKIIPHKAGWIKHSNKINLNQTVLRKLKNQDGIKNELITGFDATRITTLKRVVFLTCTFGRTKVSEIYKQNLINLENCFHKKYIFQNVIVDSENSNKYLFADDKRFEYYNYSNQPLSNKFNFGCKMLREVDFDYVIILGSDDIIDNNVFRIYDENMDKNFDIIRETTYFRH